MPRTNAREQSCIVGLGEIAGMQLGQWLADGLLRGKPIQGGCLPVPVGDHRVQVLHDDCFAALLKRLGEVTGARLGSLFLGAVNVIWIDDWHRSEAYERMGGDAMRRPLASIPLSLRVMPNYPMRSVGQPCAAEST